MSFLARIAARALGTPDESVSLLMPKDRGAQAMRAAAPTEDMAEDRPEPDTGPASRFAARRAPVEPQPEPEKKDEKKTEEPARPARRAAAEPSNEGDDKVARPLRRVAAEIPESKKPEEDASVHRATPPSAEDQPRDDQEKPNETRLEKESQKALALRPVRRDGERAAPVAGAAVAPMAPSFPAGPVDDVSSDGADPTGDWRPVDDADGFADTIPDFGDDAPSPSADPRDDSWRQNPPPLQVVSGVNQSAEHSDVVIEQIDVFVQEPASREPYRPRLSDPARLIGARYLRRL